MSDSDERTVNVCGPDCEAHPGKFAFMLVPKITTLNKLADVTVFFMTPDQAADAFDQFMQTNEGNLAMLRMLEKMLEVTV